MFIIYADCLFISLSSLNFNSDLLSFNNKKDPMEQDFVVKIWGPIISTIFDDSALFTKW